ncbi:MAG: hypothetical protein ABIP39_00525 [Polyangiaceae bacterium]
MIRTRPATILALACALHGVLLTSAPAMAQPKGSTVAQPAPPRQDLITRGRALFDDQQYEESIQTLSAALVRPVNTQEQKVEIYRLLALNYITLNRKEESESAVRGLLALDPSYALPASESPRFRDFFAATKQKWEDEGKPGLVTALVAPPAPVSMGHASPSQVDPKTAIPLTAKLDDPQHRVQRVVVFFRTGSKGKFNEIDATLQAGTARATIPATAVKPPLVEYYVEGLDKGGLPIISRGDAGAPLRVAVPEPSKGWVVPVAIGIGILVAAGIVGGLAAGGVFKGSPSTPNNPAGMKNGTVSVTIGE